jgi:hypothetical protein
LWVVVVVVDDVVVVDEEVAGVDAAAFELVCEAEPPPQPEIANPATIMLSNAFFIDATPVRSKCSPLRLQDTPGAETFRRRGCGKGAPRRPFRRTLRVRYRCGWIHLKLRPRPWTPTAQQSVGRQ